MLAWLLGQQATAAIAPAVGARHRELFLAEAGGLAPLPGARELVEHLVGYGVRVVLATSAAPEERDVLLAALDLPVPVIAVVDASAVPDPKPDPGLLHVALARPEESVMVGDARWDMAASPASGSAAAGSRRRS